MLSPRDPGPAVMFPALIGVELAKISYASVILRADAFSGLLAVQAADDDRLDALLGDPRGIHGRLADGRPLDVQYPEVEAEEVPAVAMFWVERGLITLQATDLLSLRLLHRELKGHPDVLREAIDVARASLSPTQ
jgi:hypothetical protein